MKKKSHYRPSMTLIEACWWTINRGPLTPAQLQDKTGHSSSAYTRAGCEGDTHAGLNLDRLIPLMDIQNDYTILECIAHRCGFLLLPIPRGGRSKKERITNVSEYQVLVSAATNVLVKYINEGASQEEAIEHLYKVLKSTAEMLEDVKAGDQIPLDL